MTDTAEIKEVWLLRVHHPENFDDKAGWSDVAVFKTADLARKALDLLVKASRVTNDAKGNSWELKRFDLRG
jgi:hypothetical protein